MKTLLIALLVGAIGVWAGYTLEHHISREGIEAWWGRNEHLIVFSDGANATISDSWIYFRTSDEKIYPICSIKQFYKKVNWQPHNVSLPERSMR